MNPSSDLDCSSIAASYCRKLEPTFDSIESCTESSCTATTDSIDSSDMNSEASRERILGGPDVRAAAVSNAASDGCYLWLTSIKDISDELLQELLATLALNPQEVSKVTSFYFADDQKRSLASIMLQRSLIRTHFCVKDHEYVIERTKESKPYAMSPIKQFGEWNYNVSHQGDLVAIASHGSRPIGVDLVELNSRNHNVAKTINEYVRMFEMQLAKQEMDYILKCSKQTFAENAVHTDINFPNSISEEDFKYQKFYIVWALKEAFSKALGFGLSFDLRQAVFEVRFDRFEAAGTWPANGAALCFCSGSAILTLSGQRRPDWSLRFSSIDARHLMAIAQGPSQSLHAGCVGDLHLEWKSVGSLRS